MCERLLKECNCGAPCDGEELTSELDPRVLVLCDNCKEFLRFKEDNEAFMRSWEQERREMGRME